MEFSEGAHASYSDDVAMMLRISDRQGDRFRENLTNLVHGRDIIELGASRSPMEMLLEMGPNSYTCVEPTSITPLKIPEGMTYIKNDGHSYLKNLESRNSTAIVSSGLFDVGAILEDSYARNLAQEIYTKTPEGGTTFHTIHNDAWKYFIEAGFSLDYGIYLRMGLKTEEGSRKVVLSQKDLKNAKGLEFSLLIFKK